jgi:hypothetical protein
MASWGEAAYGKERETVLEYPISGRREVSWLVINLVAESP